MTSHFLPTLPSHSPKEAAKTFGSTAQHTAEPVADVPGEMLRALVAMARVSTRHQAELQMALHRAGMSLSSGQQEAALEHLCESGSVQDMIPLEDGGVLITVTSAGVQRALAAELQRKE